MFAAQLASAPARAAAQPVTAWETTEALGPLLRRVADESKCSMVVIEHDMTLLSGLCDRLVALELGAVIASGSPGEVLSHPEVIASYLGTDAEVVARSGRRRAVSKRAPARAR